MTAQEEPLTATGMQKLRLWLRDNPMVYVCDGCLALKMGVFPREVHDALAMIDLDEPIQLGTAQCSECLQTKPVVRTLGPTARVPRAVGAAR